MMRVLSRLLLLVTAVWPGACAVPQQVALSQVPIPPSTRQVVMVTTESWAATHGWLQLWERTASGGWQSAHPGWRVMVGRGGLGWGLGLHRGGEGPQKKEGDGRAPAGLFRLGTAFGYAASAPEGVRYPYRPVDARDYFVDDVASRDYNRWRRIPAGTPNEPKARWASYERMRRDDHVYEYGVVVAHNDGCVAGRGSAIFLHVWMAPDAATSGCTSMAREHLLHLLRWLDPAAAPLLLQAPH